MFKAKKKNVFVEKPFCQTEKQYYEIKKFIKLNKVYFSTNFVLRSHPKFLKIKEIIKKKKLVKFITSKEIIIMDDLKN